MSFDKIFTHIQKTIEKDPNARIRKSGDINISSRIPFGIPSGIPEFDLRLGRPGLPAGRIIEYYGFEFSGKTTAAIQAIAQAQRMGGAGYFIDTEFAYDEGRFQELGVDTDVNFAVGEAQTIEGIFRNIEAALDGLIKSGFNKSFVIVVDSVTAVETEHNKSIEIGAESRVGEDARRIRSALRKLNSKIAESKACIIFINHAISTIATNKFAKQSASAGGHAIKFFATVRLQFTEGSDVRDGEKRIGKNIFLRIEKLKNSKLEFPKFEVVLSNDTGFDVESSLLAAMIEVGLVTHEKGSKSYMLGDQEFPKADWPNMIAKLGGVGKAYDYFLEWAIKNGKMKPWSIVGE
jgi:recombination protein RecA